jgi:hypothetical protein
MPMPDQPDRTSTERWATPCRNCGAELGAPDWDYCPRCGQETRLELPSVGEFWAHTGGRLLALDGRLWRTLAHLLSKPGVLTQAYLAGRRRYFVRPARLFFVLSLLLFGLLRLTLPSVPKGEANLTAGTAASAASAAAAVPVSTISADWLAVLDSSPDLIADPLRKRVLHYKNLSRAERIQTLDTGLIRLGPYVLFALLPLYAGLMQLVYLGRSARYPSRPRRYGEHLVQGAYMHCSLLLTLILIVLLPWVWVRVALGLWLLVYLARCQYAVYGGSRWGALLRGILVTLVYLVFAMITQQGMRYLAALL